MLVPLSLSLTVLFTGNVGIKHRQSEMLRSPTLGRNSPPVALMHGDQKNNGLWKLNFILRLPSSMVFNDIITHKPCMASPLNHHFGNPAKSLFPNDLTTVLFVNQHCPSSNIGFSMKSFSIPELQDEQTKMDPNKSAGSNGSDLMFLKVPACIIAAPITNIFHM